MSLEGTGRVIMQWLPDGRVGKCYIYVPMGVARDSQLPEGFRTKGPVNLRIEGGTLIVSLPDGGGQDV